MKEEIKGFARFICEIENSTRNIKVYDLEKTVKDG
jgi:hypothetical protein